MNNNNKTKTKTKTKPYPFGQPAKHKAMVRCVRCVSLRPLGTGTSQPSFFTVWISFYSRATYIKMLTMCLGCCRYRWKSHNSPFYFLTEITKCLLKPEFWRRCLWESWQSLCTSRTRDVKHPTPQAFGWKGSKLLEKTEAHMEWRVTGDPCSDDKHKERMVWPSGVAVPGLWNHKTRQKWAADTGKNCKHLDL